MNGLFTSYAQNFEDVILWRALGSVGTGFYIDVGASDPVFDSVTKAFYEAGWRGINIEPVPRPFEALQEDRPRDINLNVAVGESVGVFEIFIVEGRDGLSTGVENYAERYEAEGMPVDKVVVPRRTLAEICETEAVTEVHFLKIDVEGAERAVLEGADFKRWRPWVVVVEATEPMSRTPSFEQWEELLTRADYSFVFFDGLNRFYLAKERQAELGHAFTAPANFLDMFERYREAEYRNQMEELQRTVTRQADELDACQQEVFEGSRVLGVLSRDLHNAKLAMTQAQAETKRLAQQLVDQKRQNRVLQKRQTQMRNSASWKVTRPLRVAARAARTQLRKG